MNVISMQRLLKISVFTLATIYFSSCSHEKYDKSTTPLANEMSKDFDTEVENKFEGQESHTSIQQLPTNLMVIKSATARYKVDHVKMTTYKIKQMIDRYDSYLASMKFNNDPYLIENKFTIRVPQRYFDTLLDSLNAMAQFVDYENIEADDISEEYTDIKTRLKTKTAVKTRYEDILRKNAKTVEDILATEDKLRIIQEEIEAAEGRLKFLANQVTYSTIQIELYQTVDFKEEPTTYKKTFLAKSREGLLFGWGIIEKVVLAVIYLWPMTIIGILIFILLRKRSTKKSDT